MHDDRDARDYGYSRGGGGGGNVHGTVRLFVHNLSYRTSWQDLKDHARQARGGGGGGGGGGIVASAIP